MKNWLLFLAVAAALVVSGPAYSQYAYIDVNGDGVNSQNPLNAGAPDDVLTAGTYSIDLWYVTNANRDASTANCPYGPEPMSFFGYEAALVTTGTGTVTFNSWTDLMGFPDGLVLGGDGTMLAVAGSAWIGRGGETQNPGAYKVGSLNITVTQSPKLDFVASNPSLHPASQTAFLSQCLGAQFDGSMRLGEDWFNTDGTESPTPVVPTTWGKIKTLYR